MSTKNLLTVTTLTITYQGSSDKQVLEILDRAVQNLKYQVEDYDPYFKIERTSTFSVLSESTTEKE